MAKEEKPGHIYIVKGTSESLQGQEHISSNSYKVSRQKKKHRIRPECPDSREKKQKSQDSSLVTAGSQEEKRKRGRKRRKWERSNALF